MSCSSVAPQKEKKKCLGAELVRLQSQHVAQTFVQLDRARMGGTLFSMPNYSEIVIKSLAAATVG